MKEQLVDDWIEALRSGLYTQGKFRLQCDGQYCCLGVLALLIDEDAWCEMPIDGADNGWGWRYGDSDIDNQNLPSDILDFEIQGKLTNLNDRDNTTFEEIADYIEQNKGDFVDG